MRLDSDVVGQAITRQLIVSIVSEFAATVQRSPCLAPTVHVRAPAKSQGEVSWIHASNAGSTAR
jgi:hypothetical protein